VAVGLLTIAPVPTTAAGSRSLRHAIAFFPIVGLLLGAATAALDSLLRLVFPIPVATVVDLAFLAIASGGLHLDGLADATDGLFAVGDRERRLAAMRDSRTGAFGAVSVALVLLLEFAALSGVAPGDRAPALILAATLSRWAMSLAVWAFAAARALGLGAAFAREVTVVDIVIASATMGVIVGAVAPVLVGGTGVLVAGGLALGVGSFAVARVGGLTGDVYGAIGELVFACELTALTTRGL
jgi:adenosylcobinamide-GDP ribazoletransferase